MYRIKFRIIYNNIGIDVKILCPTFFLHEVTSKDIMNSKPKYKNPSIHET